MANYQNNMRYSRMGNAYLQQRQNQGNTRDTSCTMCGATREETCSSCTADMRDSKNMNAYTIEDLHMPLAMAYVPWQKWCDIYETCKGFQRGTIFSELDKPFMGKGGCNR